MASTSTPSTSLASRASHSRAQITLITFQPAPVNTASSSWITLPLPRTGPSSRCRLQLTTNVRLSSPSRGEVAVEARLVDGIHGPQTHADGGELPELGHEARMRVAREPPAGGLAA